MVKEGRGGGSGHLPNPLETPSGLSLETLPDPPPKAAGWGEPPTIVQSLPGGDLEGV